MTKEDLIKENPWTKLIEKIEANGYRCMRENFAEGFDDHKILKTFLESSDERYKIHLEMLPSHFKGNILEADIVIFALNPGYSNEENKNGFYDDPDLNKIRIKHLKFEYKYFFPMEDSVREKWKKRSPYWFNKLSPLWKNSRDPETTFRTVSKSIALLQLFPYHSLKWSNNFLKLPLKTVEYSKRIALYLIQQGKTIIIARGRSHWFNLVKELKTYHNLYIVLNPRNPYISPNNIAKVVTHSDFFEGIGGRILNL